MAKTRHATLADRPLGQDLKTAQDAATLQAQEKLKSDACRDKNDDKLSEPSLSARIFTGPVCTGSND